MMALTARYQHHQSTTGPIYVLVASANRINAGIVV
jgi:hypothetical protein